MQSSVVGTATPLPCPNCRQAMDNRVLPRSSQGDVSVDLCLPCAGIWFDHFESVQLSPAAVIDLFKEIHAHAQQAAQPAATRLECPRCKDGLSLSFDLGKAGRFSYYRCERCDGRFTPFFQFLREKQFVRSLTPAELQRIRDQVRQITCSSCGAPIDLEHQSECRYCHTPVSFLDAEAVERAMKMWSAAEDRRRQGPSPEALADAMLKMQLRPSDTDRWPSLPATTGLGRRLPMAGLDPGPATAVGLGLDLVALGIHAVAQLFEP